MSEKPKNPKKSFKKPDAEAEEDSDQVEPKKSAKKPKSDKKNKERVKTTFVEENDENDDKWPDKEEEDESEALDQVKPMKKPKLKKSSKKPSNRSASDNDLDVKSDNNTEDSESSSASPVIKPSRLTNTSNPIPNMRSSVLNRGNINNNNNESKGAESNNTSYKANKSSYNTVANQNAENRLLLTNLIESEQYSGLIKSIFDRGWTSRYNSVTQSNIQIKQDEINNICRTNYNEFIGTVDNLLTMKLDINDFRSSIINLNNSVQKSGENVVKLATQLSNDRLTLLNINKAKLTIKNCQYLIQLAEKVEAQIEAKKYFGALKTIDQLKLLHLNSYKNKFEFANLLLLEIPKLIMKIKTKVKLEFIKWSNSIHHKSLELGSFALKQADKQLITIEKIKQKRRKFKEKQMKLNNENEDKNSENNSENEEENENEELLTISNSSGSLEGFTMEEDDESLLDRVGINFAPVYQCLHIYEQLQIADQFIQLYKDKRRQQAIQAVELKFEINNINKTKPNTNTNITTSTTTTTTSAKPNPISTTTKDNKPIASSPIITGKDGKSTSTATATTTKDSTKPSNATKDGKPAGTNPFDDPLTSSKDSKSSESGNISNPNTDFLSIYTNFFSHICGFFIVESSVLRSGNSLLLSSEVESLWQLAVTKIQIVLSEQFPLIDSVDSLLQIKYTATLLCKVMKSYNYDVVPLTNYLFTNRTHFELLLHKRIRSDLKEILTIEKFEPMVIQDEKQYTEFVLAYNLANTSEFHHNIHITYPTVMPFSLCVPLFIRVILMFIADCYQFTQYLIKDYSELYTALIRAVDSALIQEINTSFNHIIDTTPTLHISQAVQFSINAQAMADSCTFIEYYIQNYIQDDFTDNNSNDNNNNANNNTNNNNGKELASPMNINSPIPDNNDIKSPNNNNNNNNSGNISPSNFSLTARNFFQQTRIRCEDLVFELIDSKIDEFMSLASNLDWTPNDSNKASSDYINDLISYLSTTLVCFQYMPEAVRSAVHFTSCKHIAANLLNNLVNNVKKFNILAIVNLDLDLTALETFAFNCNIPNLIETFSEIRQLCNLLLSGEIEAILNTDYRAQTYPHLSNGKLLKILDKFKDVGLFSKLANENLKKIKRKNVENLMKKLKA